MSALATTSLRQWGNSIAARIPKEAIEQSKIKKDDVLDVVASNGIIVLRKKRQKKFSDFAEPLFDTVNIKFDREEANAR